MLKIVVPHVAEAWRHCQIHVLLYPNRPLIDLSDAFLHGRSITDSLGRISQADPGFGAALDSVFPNWIGPQLPIEITAFGRRELPSLTVGVLRFSSVHGRQHHVIGVMGTAKGSRLTSAEFDIARRIIAGDSDVRIAAARSVSSATVRNQIASIYDKLAVHSKVELIVALSALLTS